MEELLVGSFNNQHHNVINYWNSTTGNVVHVHKSKFIPVQNTLAFLKNDYLLIAEDQKPLIHYWPINNQEESKSKLILPGVASALTVDSSSTYLIVGIGVKTYIWHISSGELMGVLQKHYQPITVVKISQNDQYLVAAGKDGMLVTYNFADAVCPSVMGQVEPVYSKMDHSKEITDIHIGNFGNKSRLTSISLDHSCRIYSLHDGAPLLVLVYQDGLTSVMFDPCWNNVFVGDTKGAINAVTFKEEPIRNTPHHVTSDKVSFQGHTKRIHCLDLNFKSDVLASASEDCLIILWNLKSREQVHKIKSEVPVVYLKFILKHNNTHSRNFKPTAIIKPLKKNAIGDVGELEVAIYQNGDISFDDDGGVTVEVDKNTEEIENLKRINNELYSAFVNFSKKYNKLN